jgi:hypothetical protein
MKLIHCPCRAPKELFTSRSERNDDLNVTILACRVTILACRKKFSTSKKKLFGEGIIFLYLDFYKMVNFVSEDVTSLVEAPG